MNKDSVLLTVLPTKAQLPLHLIRHVNTLCQVLIVLSQKQAKFKQKFTCKKKYMVKNHTLEGLILIPYLTKLLLKSRTEKEEKILPKSYITLQIKQKL